MYKKLVILAAAVVSSIALAAPTQPTVVISTIQSSDTSIVPGLPAGQRLGFLHPRGWTSPDGTKWLHVARMTNNVHVILVGDVATGTVESVLLEHTHVEGRRFRDPSPYAKINNLGQYVLHVDLGQSPDSEDTGIIRCLGVDCELFALESQPLPLPYELQNYGAFATPSVWNDGRVSFVVPFTQSNNSYLIHGGKVVAETNVTVPGNQTGGTTRTYDQFEFDTYRSVPGTYFFEGSLDGDTLTDGVIVVNGSVVIQERSPIPDWEEKGDVFQIFESNLDDAGNWMVAGSLDGFGSPDWLVRNGEIVALSGDPVPNGIFPANEFYSNEFRNFRPIAGNGVGDFVLRAVTINNSGQFDVVLVLNGTDVLLRQGSAVDVDGNGLLDDDAYFASLQLGTFRGNLTPSGELWVQSQLVNSAGTGIGSAIVRMQIPRCIGDLAGSTAGPPDSMVDVIDLNLLLSNWNQFGPGAQLAPPFDIVDVADLFALLAAWGACS